MTMSNWLKKHWSGVRRTALLGAVLGLAYGLATRFVIATSFSRYFGLISVAFLFLVPLVIGYLAVFPADNPRLRYRVLVPWIPVTLAVLIAALVGWEGAICILMSAPMLLILSSLGGLIGAAHHRRRAHHALVIAVLPFAVAPLESMLRPPLRIESNVTEIVVNAPPADVWQHVVAVPTITEREQRAALYTRIGFPRPISAELIGTGVGAVRHARFGGGVLFIEEITAWENERRIAFTIDARTESIPATTLDPHVTIGGEYFDVLTGEYLLVPLGNNRTRVVLTSTHRVSTTLNVYTGWWARTIMKSIQRNILEVVKARAERQLR